MNKIISIVGVRAELIPMNRKELKGINADTLLRFSFYTTTFNNQSLCIIRCKNDEGYTPLKYKRITQQIEKVVGRYVVIQLNKLTYYERERFIHQGVYFIISDKYAFLPSLIVNTFVRKKDKKATKLTPAAQYLLLYYLMTDKINNFTIKALEEMVPYNYLALSRAVINLEDCKLCQTSKDDTGTKIIRFAYPKWELWEKAQKYLSSPIKKVVFSDSLPEDNFRISGINALSQYSHLNPEQYGSVAIWDRDFQAEDKYNEIEGNYQIEIWKYPTTMPNQFNDNIVDKLSLYLSMKGDPDARIEKELELLIEGMKW